jgi:S-adenosyl methyltransferase
MSAEGLQIQAGHDAADVNTASPARMYDCWLGGKDNFKVDRVAAARVEALIPNIRIVAQENRAFLRRAVRYLVDECGIRQFVDIGSGLPTVGNVHEVAQGIAPGTRVVYVDNDPIVLSHGRAVLAKNEHTTVITADLREPDAILKSPELLRLINPDEPVGLLMVASLHFISDAAKPCDLLKSYRGWVPIGSRLVISHADSTPEARSAAKVYDDATARAVPRTHSAVREFFGELKLADPGVVPLPAWRPPRGIIRRRDIPVWGGIGCKTKAETTDG